MDMSPCAQPTLIAVTLDIEMCRNFPTWDGTDHWDYQKAELDEATRTYSLAAARRLRASVGRAHCFVLGRSLGEGKGGAG